MTPQLSLENQAASLSETRHRSILVGNIGKFFASLISQTNLNFHNSLAWGVSSLPFLPFPFTFTFTSFASSLVSPNSPVLTRSNFPS